MGQWATAVDHLRLEPPEKSAMNQKPDYPIQVAALAVFTAIVLAALILLLG